MPVQEFTLPFYLGYDTVSMCNCNPTFRGNVLSSFRRVKLSAKRNFLQYTSIFKDYETTWSRNVRELLPTETSYQQGTESSSSAVYIQISSVFFFCAKKSNLHAFTNSDSNCNHDVALSYGSVKNISGIRSHS